jgi:hypothetical protein
MSEKLDPYYYAREHDGSGWSVRGPNGFCIQKVDGPMDKNVAYIIAKLLSDKPADALSLLRDINSPREEADEAFECPECGDLHLADYHRAPDKPALQNIPRF